MWPMEPPSPPTPLDAAAAETLADAGRIAALVRGESAETPGGMG
jgi:hypothetical protein